MKRSNEWEKFVGLVEEFIYGDDGIFTALQNNQELETYILDTDKVVEILKQYKLVLDKHNGLNEDEKRELEMLKTTFLDMDFGNGKVVGIYNKIVEIYENLEVYID